MNFPWFTTTNRDLLEEILSQLDDLTAAVQAANDALTAVQQRDATIVAGVQALQAAVTDLQNQLAQNQPDLSGVTAQVNNIASALGSIDTENTDVPQG